MLEPQRTDRNLVPSLTEYGLTKRQQEITMGVISGLSNRELADQLFICEQTVKDHLHDIFERLKIHRRSELSAKVLRLAPEAPATRPRAVA